MTEPQTSAAQTAAGQTAAGQTAAAQAAPGPAGPVERTVEYVVNGQRRVVRAGDDDLLLDVLREQVGITSAREGCGVGACGACTVLVGGHSVSSCLARAVRYVGAEISTADGLAPDHPLITAFVQSGAMQCGYCVPGFVLMADELLRENPAPTRDEIVAHLEGNICRCGTYQEIVAAVELAAEWMAGPR